MTFRFPSPSFAAPLASAGLCLSSALSAPEPFEAFLETHCLRCHGPEKEKGDLSLDQLSRDFKLGADTHHWAEVIEQVNSGEMPPNKEKRPTQGEIASFVTSLDALIKEGRAARMAARPVKNEEMEEYLKSYREEREAGEKLAEAYRVALQGVLTSRHFLYLVEDDPVARERLNDAELATRLSYFLWSSMPDDALFAAPKGGQLSGDGLGRAVDRMLADGKSSRFKKSRRESAKTRSSIPLANCPTDAPSRTPTNSNNASSKTATRSPAPSSSTSAPTASVACSPSTTRTMSTPSPPKRRKADIVSGTSFARWRCRI
jgi:hypothetical protein